MSGPNGRRAGGHARDRSPARHPRPDLAAVLRELGDRQRLAVLKSVAAGEEDAEQIASSTGLDIAQVRRHLAALGRAGLRGARTERRREAAGLAQQAVSLLEKALAYGGAETLRVVDPYEVATPATVPLAPLACRVCDNRQFVTNVLGDLGHAVSEAREYHQRLQEMSSQVLNAHEAERKRIARELHDDTAQSLTSILVRLRLLERSTPDDNVQRNVVELRELTSSALDAVRRLAMDLRPASLDDLGLVPAAEAFADRFTQGRSVRATVEATGIKRRLPPDVELVLYRVIQEALNNVAKHADAQQAKVTISRRGNFVTLVVEDDGEGFEPQKVESGNGSGLGLFGMKERLALVGGDLRVESAKGQGTQIIARVPLKAAGATGTRR